MEPAWMDLLNSDWHDYRGSGRSEDRLANPNWLKGFLRRWSGAPQAVSPDRAAEALRELRSLLRRIVDAAISGRPIPGKARDLLNSYLAGSPVVRHLEKAKESYQLQLLPVAQDLDFILSDIALSFAEVLAEGDLARIKICENSDCLWVFYDNSRNRSRRWCEGSGCGNLMKVRRFRERQRKRMK
ncbi:MAG TPA: ABATE domain-containing protein [Acidobacteriota bacterium]|nr:ABATE domain-containing protein [Acidobacteriota bacterium]